MKTKNNNWDMLIKSARQGLLSAYNNTKNVSRDERNAGRNKIQKKVIETITTNKPNATKVEVSNTTNTENNGSRFGHIHRWFSDIVDKSRMSPETKALMEDNSVKGQDTGIHSSSKAGNAATGKLDFGNTEDIIVDNSPQSWEPETGHSGIEESFAVARHTYDPNTGKMTMLMKEDDGRATGKLKVDFVSDDDFLNYLYSPSKGRWAIGNRNQDLERGEIMRMYAEEGRLGEVYKGEQGNEDSDY